jgi:hypothetical protein
MTDDRWLCTARNGSRVLVRCAPHDLTAHEVRALAARKLGGADPPSLVVERTTEDPPGVPVVRVRWTGSDYAPGQGPRRLQEWIRDAWRDV